MSYSEPCPFSNKLLQKLEALDTDNKLNFHLIEKAIGWAKKYHEGQYRKSGEPYYTHPLEVAYIVAEYKLNDEVIVSSILHDIVEDTEVTVGMLVDEFGWRIAEMVDRLTRIRPDGSKLNVETIILNAYRLKDTDVLLIKLFDRLHNLMTIKAMTIERQKRTINETLLNFILLSEFLELPSIGKTIHRHCINSEEDLFVSFSLLNDNYQPLSLIYQND